MSEPARLERDELAIAAPAEASWTPRSIHLRRASAVRERRRRLLLIDLGIAVAAALIALVVGPGLAIVAIAAAFVLALCGASLLYGVTRRRRDARRSRRRARS